jgi:hypothetical protein
MDSFYGGRPGAPFVIKKVFKSVEEMKAKFKTGPEYKVVWYGEYCLINTPNRNHRDNGKLYQRGFDYLEDDKTAICIGQLVGSQGGLPSVQIGSIEEVRALFNGNENMEVDEVRSYPGKTKDGDEIKYLQVEATKETDEETNTKKKIHYYNMDTSTQDDVSEKSPTLQEIKDSNAAGEGMFVSGSETDHISYTWANIVYPATDGEDNTYTASKTLVGFKIPYADFREGTVGGFLPYDEEGKFQKDFGKVKVTQTANPFLNNISVRSASGIKGDSSQIIGVAKSDLEYEEGAKYVTYNGEPVYNLSALKTDEPTTSEEYDYSVEKAKNWTSSSTNSGTPNTEGNETNVFGESSRSTYYVNYSLAKIGEKKTNESDDEYEERVYCQELVNAFEKDSTTSNSAKYYLVKWTTYTEDVNGTDYYFYLNDCNSVEKVSYDSKTGQLTISYTGKSNDDYDIPAITSFKVDDGHKVTVGFNNKAVNLKAEDFKWEDDKTNGIPGGTASLLDDNKTIVFDIPRIKKLEVKNDFAASRGERGNYLEATFDTLEGDKTSTSLAITDSTPYPTPLGQLNAIEELRVKKQGNRPNALYALYSDHKNYGDLNARDVFGVGETLGGVTITDSSDLKVKFLGYCQDSSGILAGHDFDKLTFSYTEDGKNSVIDSFKTSLNNKINNGFSYQSELKQGNYDISGSFTDANAQDKLSWVGVVSIDRDISKSTDYPNAFYGEVNCIFVRDSGNTGGAYPETPFRCNAYINDVVVDSEQHKITVKWMDTSLTKSHFYLILRDGEEVSCEDKVYGASVKAVEKQIQEAVNNVLTESLKVETATRAEIIKSEVIDFLNKHCQVAALSKNAENGLRTGYWDFSHNGLQNGKLVSYIDNKERLTYCFAFDYNETENFVAEQNEGEGTGTVTANGVSCNYTKKTDGSYEYDSYYPWNTYKTDESGNTTSEIEACSYTAWYCVGVLASSSGSGGGGVVEDYSNADSIGLVDKQKGDIIFGNHTGLGVSIGRRAFPWEREYTYPLVGMYVNASD